ncbi:hypothetical protein VPNG_02328 [Cytospora leucostoma]|uniref:Uncharacterized protein n=1 Tax=Cytospora leucostoma TaxID=1230097 RepID=A0A423XHE0_9PEZI|nr:hypothetical protein VPNG_02328 [Cytospora leucostoma]
MDWLGLTISTLYAIFYGLKISTLTVVSLAVSLLRLALYPVAVLWSILLFILTPVIYTFRFILSPLFFVVRNFPRLEPIYIYFGSAAFVGITFGLIFTLTSSGIVSVLGLNDSPDQDQDNKKKKTSYANSSSSPYDHDQDAQERYEWSKSPPGIVDTKHEELQDLLRDLDVDPKFEPLWANIDSADSDLGSLTRRDWRDSPNSKRKRGSAAALRIGTILEEDDDSL